MLLTGKRRKGFCLSFANKICGRTADVPQLHVTVLLCEVKEGVKVIYT